MSNSNGQKRGEEPVVAQACRSGVKRPLLFLDVDGVLNCPGPFQDNYEFLPGMPGGVFVPPGVRERVHRLIEVYDPVWCTAWLGRAHSSWKDYLGLEGEPWPWVNYRQYKLTELIRLAAGRPFAYVDDDVFTYELRGLGWTEDMVDGLLVQPDHRVGLTDEHVEQLLAYAAALTPNRQAEEDGT